MISVYVAGSSRELQRARHWMNRLREEGIEVTSKWVEGIELVGEANPREAPVVDRRRWSNDCTRGVLEADVVWCLVSPTISAGMYFEAGVAYVKGSELLFSGDTTQSIFGSQGEEFPTDEGAFETILHLARSRGAL